MKKRSELHKLFFVITLFIFILSINFKTSTAEFNPGPEGPSQEEVSCMESCVSVGCEAGDMACMESNSEACGVECGVETTQPIAEDEGESCMQSCVVIGCEVHDFDCQEDNFNSCEEECDMLGDAPDMSDMSDEEICISECVDKEDPTIICGASAEGETGNALCQRCTEECVHLYEGPCLSDEEISSKERDCKTCEHCYGEPVMGPSGQGWDCIVDIKCEDASDEFGDDPGTGPDSWEPGHEPSADNMYWWDYETNLDISETSGTLLIENNEGEEEIIVDIEIEEGVFIEQNEEKIAIKNQEVEIEVENNIDKLIISEKGNKRHIQEINIKIEEDKAVYEYDEKEKARLLGLIPIDKNVKKKVDAENMEMLEEKGPWWEFLSVEEKEREFDERRMGNNSP